MSYGEVVIRICGTCLEVESECKCLEGAEAPPQQNGLDQQAEARAMDQRIGRTYQETEDERKQCAERADDIHKSGGYPIREYWLNRGAALALSWALDDDSRPVPLRERLRNAAEGRG